MVSFYDRDTHQHIITLTDLTLPFETRALEITFKIAKQKQTLRFDVCKIIADRDIVYVRPILKGVDE